MIKWIILIVSLLNLVLSNSNKSETNFRPDSIIENLQNSIQSVTTVDLKQSLSLTEELNKSKVFHEEEEELVSGAEFWLFILIVLFLTLFAGLMSGLTVGYLSIDDFTLELRSNNGTEEEKKHAALVLPILATRHWLLVTLLLMNSFAMEALPVFLDRIVNRFLAVVISVTLVLSFGEVIPQAVCTGPNQVQIAAAVAPLVKFLMIISYPVSYSIAKLLDIILGEHHKSRFNNSDLKTLVELHTYKALKKLAEEEEKHTYINKEEIAKPSDKMGLNDMEADLMISALEIREKKVRDIMIPFDRVFLLDFDEKIEKPQLRQILEKGYSRIPVYRNKNKQDIIGLIRIKQLIMAEITKSTSLKEMGIHLKLPIVISPNMNLMDVLRQFNQGKSHMAFITDQVEKLQGKLGLNRTNSLAIENQYLQTSQGDLGITILGIITLEDVIERIFKFEILDEDDYEKAKIQKGKGGQRANSKINTFFTKEVAKNFIQEESEKINSYIKENSKKISMKDKFEMEVYSSNDKPSSGLKTPLIENR